jgi:hypothetical protein
VPYRGFGPTSLKNLSWKHGGGPLVRLIIRRFHSEGGRGRLFSLGEMVYRPIPKFFYMPDEFDLNAFTVFFLCKKDARFLATNSLLQASLERTAKLFCLPNESDLNAFTVFFLRRIPGSKRLSSTWNVQGSAERSRRPTDRIKAASRGPIETFSCVRAPGLIWGVH